MYQKQNKPEAKIHGGMKGKNKTSYTGAMSKGGKGYK
jgi:hypothetical protein|tara:strand:- start:106 stop:216 length:111 start_codon:yes stop_codon:yes gene_type:complete